MKKFIMRLSLFFFLFLFIAMMSYVLFARGHVFLPAVEYDNKQFNRAFDEKSIEFVALGNSKVMASFNASLFEDKSEISTVNLGYMGSNLSVSKLTLQSYLNNAIKKPKVVILEVSWFSFNNRRTHFYSLSGDLFLRSFNLYPHLIEYRPQSLHAYRSTMFKQLKSFIIMPESINKVNVGINKKKDFDLVEFEKVFPNHIAGIDSTLLKDFYFIVDECMKNDITLVLYTAPEGKEYSKFQKDREEIKNIFYDLDNKNPSLIYLDYTLGGKFYHEKYEEWMADSHHIAKKNLFTKVLLKDIIHSNILSGTSATPINKQ